jgi:excisionase family DNA binding protein
MKSENPFEILNSRLDEIFLRLEEIQNSKVSTATMEESNEILTVKQAAEYLNLSIYSIYAKTSQKSIPHAKRGRHLYFFKDDLRNWLASAKSKTRE